MIAFLKTVLIILLVYYVGKILLKWLTPYLLRYLAKKAGKKFEQAFDFSTRPTHRPKKKGSISIDDIPKPKNKSKSKVGEYVDYEEID